MSGLEKYAAPSGLSRYLAGDGRVPTETGEGLAKYLKSTSPARRVGSDTGGQ